MAHQRATRIGAFILEFYAKRIRRIVPALAACLMMTSVLAVLFIPQSWLSDNSRNTGVLAFFGASNMSLMQSGDDYFAPRAEYNPFTHTWSLGVEEQFYVAFPLVFFLWMRTRARNDIWSQIGTVLLASLIVLSLVLCQWLGTRNPTQAFYLMPSRFWELGAGALLFLLHDRGRLIVRSSLTAQIVLLVSLGLIATGFAASSMQAFPLPWALCPVLGTLGIIACTARTPKQGGIGRFLANPAAVWVGKISYSLYLWHWPIYVLFRWTVGLEDARYQVLALLITVAISAASYYAVERRFRFNVRLTRLTSGSLVTASVVSLIGLASVSFALFYGQSHVTLSVTGARSAWYVSDRAPSNAAEPECRTAGSTRGVEGMGITEFRKPGCAKATGRPTLYVVGDSHAAAYMSLLRRLADEQSVEVIVYKGPGCAFLPLFQSSLEVPPRCAAFSSQVVQQIAGRSRPGDIVFLPSLRVKRLADQWGGLATARTLPDGMHISEQSRQAALHDAAELLPPWLSSGLRVVFEAPTPIFRASLFRCSDWFNRMNPACGPGFSMSRAYLEAYRQPTMESLASLRSSFPAIIVWDPLPILCPGATCSASDAAGPLFFDSDHLSGHANAVLYEPFVSVMRPLGLFEARR